MVRCVAWAAKGMTPKKLQDEYQGMAPDLGFGVFFFCIFTSCF